MYKKTEVEMARLRALKTFRAAIRLKYALMAEEEINETLPAVEEEFNRAVAEGRPFKLLVGEVFKSE